MHTVRKALLLLVTSTTLVGCATSLDTDAGSPVSSRLYNTEIERQGLAHYCGSGNCDTPPRLERAVAPLYPAKALQAGISGEAAVLFQIDATGAVVNARIESASAPEFGEAALQAIRQWRYRPALLKGKPVSIGTSRQKIPFRPHR